MAREAHASLLKGREAARKLSIDALVDSFKDWSGRAPFTAWPSEAESSTALGLGETVDLPFLEVVDTFVKHAEGPPLPKGEGHVIAFGTSLNGGSADADCEQVTWILLDDDGAGDLRPLTDLLRDIGVAFIAQRRGVKWHLHLPLATPILVPQPYDPAWKKMHVARMEWATGVFSELAGLDLDLKAKKKVYGFDAQIPCLRVLGICYPYARRKEEDEVPETLWSEGRALDLGALLGATDFEYSPSTGTPRVIALAEAEGRRAALSAAKMVRDEFSDGKLALVCPWSTDITKNGHEPGGPTSTVMFKNGVWHCSHETCSGRSWRDIDVWLGDNVPEARELSWMSQITYNDKGAVKASIHNALLIFEHDPAWRGALKYNERACETVVTRDPPWGEGRTVNDAFLTRVTGWLARQWGIESFDMAARCIEAVARKFTFDPVVDYLNGLQWDGVPRIGSWLVRYLGADDTPLNNEVGRLWLISAVKRALQPGCQADHMLVLEGAQGVGKTSAFKILGGEWYSDVTTIHDTKAMERLQGFWIMEMDELAAATKAETEALKNFITRRSDSWRAAYARVVEQHPRRCIFAGTTNDIQYLEDLENRRVWPVRVTSLDFAGLERDRDQLFAEAVVRANAGDVWHIVDKGMQRLAAEAQGLRRFANPWEDKIAAYLTGLTVTTTHKVMHIALGIETRDQSRYYKSVGRIVRGLGWEPRTIMRPGAEGQTRYLVKKTIRTSDIRWSDLGGGTLAKIQGGKS